MLLEALTGSFPRRSHSRNDNSLIQTPANDGLSHRWLRCDFVWSLNVMPSRPPQITKCYNINNVGITTLFLKLSSLVTIKL